MQQWGDEAGVHRTQLAAGSFGRILPTLCLESSSTTDVQERKRQKRRLLFLKLGQRASGKGIKFQHTLFLEIRTLVL